MLLEKNACHLFKLFRQLFSIVQGSEEDVIDWKNMKLE